MPDVTGIDSPTFKRYVHGAVEKVFGGEDVPGTVEIRRHAADPDYLPIDWEGIRGGQDYRTGFPSGRSDLQRRSEELLSSLGPKIAAIQQRYAQQHGWTTNPDVWVWDRPGFAKEPDPRVIPSPPAPWRVEQPNFEMPMAADVFGGPPSLFQQPSDQPPGFAEGGMLDVATGDVTSFDEQQSPLTEYLGKIGQDLTDFAAHPLAHLEQRARDIGQAFVGTAAKVVSCLYLRRITARARATESASPQ